MDVAKAVAYFSINKIPIEKCYGVNNLENKRSPLIQVPTTAGTGSEITPIAIFTLKSEQKMGIVDPILYADSVILDADLTLELPKHITAYSGIDAMVHAIEAYTTKLKKNTLSDLLAKKALSLLGENIKTVVEVPNNRIARQKMLLGSMLAGMAFSQTRLGNVHAMSHPTGAQYGVHHGLANAILLPYVMEFNFSSRIHKFGNIAKALGADVAGLSVREAAETAIDYVWTLNEDLQIPKTLGECGVKKSGIRRLSKATMDSGNVSVNPRKTLRSDIEAIFNRAI